MPKIKIMGFAAIFFLLAVNASPQAEDTIKRAKERAKIYAATIAAKQRINKISEKSPDTVIADLSQSMHDPKLIDQHKSRQTSEKTGYQFTIDWLSKELNKEIETIYDSFSFDDESFTRDKFTGDVRNKFRTDMDKKFGEFIKSNFQNIFKESRKKAINHQLDQLSDAIYPTENEISEYENAHLSGWKDIDRNRLITKLMLKLSKEESHLFEEIFKLREDVSHAVFNDIKYQIKLQEEALVKELAKELITSSQLKSALKKNVDEVINTERNNASHKLITSTTDFKNETIEVSKQIKRKVYDIFSFVENKINTNARIEEKERFRMYCRSSRDVQSWNSVVIEEVILADLKSHIDKSKSKEKFIEVFWEELGHAIIISYCTLAPEREKLLFKERLEGYLREADMQIEVKNKCSQMIEDDFKTARDKIANNQFREYFQKVWNKTWEIPRLSKKEHAEKPDIMKKVKGYDGKISILSYDDCIRDPIKSEIAENTLPDTLIDETKKSVLETVKLLVMEGDKAWDGQWNIYLYHHPYIEDAKINKKIAIEDEIRRKANWNKENWVEYFTNEIKKIWKENRVLLIWQGNMPPYGKSKYDVLYEHIEKQIAQQLNTDVAKILAKLEAEEKARIKAEAEEKARAEAEALAKAEAEEKARAEAEALAKAEAEAKARAEVEAREKAEAEAKARAEAEARTKKAEAGEKVRVEAEAPAKAEAETKAREEAETKTNVQKGEGTQTTQNASTGTGGNVAKGPGGANFGIGIQGVNAQRGLNYWTWLLDLRWLWFLLIAIFLLLALFFGFLGLKNIQGVKQKTNQLREGRETTLGLKDFKWIGVFFIIIFIFEIFVGLWFYLRLLNLRQTTRANLISIIDQEARSQQRSQDGGTTYDMGEYNILIQPKSNK